MYSDGYEVKGARVNGELVLIPYVKVKGTADGSVLKVHATGHVLVHETVDV